MSRSQLRNSFDKVVKASVSGASPSIRAARGGSNETGAAPAGVAAGVDSGTTPGTDPETGAVITLEYMMWGDPWGGLWYRE